MSLELASILVDFFCLELLLFCLLSLHDKIIEIRNVNSKIEFFIFLEFYAFNLILAANGLLYAVPAKLDCEFGHAGIGE
jgi:hypothetical protein